MTKLRCCFCQQELEIGGVDGILRGCPKCRNLGTEMLWQELIRTRKELEQSETCCTEWEKQALDYKAENIALSGDLERTRKALDVAIHRLNQIAEHDCDQGCMYVARNALEQITALEQKESAFVHNKIEFPEYNDGLLEEFDKQFFENGQDDDLTETALEQKNHFANASKKVEQKDK